MLNHAQPGKLTKSSVAFLRQNGGTVIDAPITNRQAYAAAATVGKSGPEIEKGDAARKQIDALWAAVKKPDGAAEAPALRRLRHRQSARVFEIGEDGRIIALSHAQATNAGALDHKGRV